MILRIDNVIAAGKSNTPYGPCHGYGGHTEGGIDGYAWYVKEKKRKSIFLYRCRNKNKELKMITILFYLLEEN